MAANDKRDDPLDEMLVAARQHAEVVVFVPPKGVEFVPLRTREMEPPDIYAIALDAMEHRGENSL